MARRMNLSFLDQWILEKIYQALGRPPFQLRLAVGAEVSPASTPPLGSITIRDRATLARLLFDPEVGFGDAYMDGSIRVQGNLESMLESVFVVMPDSEHQNWWVRTASRWMSRVQRNSLTGSRQNIHQHYDLGNDFYRLWLDRRMVYTCAYYPSPSASLEEAQLAKMEHVSRKLQLHRGERVVEAGCGWGALALHMAQNHGVRVRAFNISGEQVAFARERAKQLGLADRVEYVEDDYRNISGKYDVFVSIGMLEHVGPENYAELGSVLARTLDTSGRGLVHFIGRSRPGKLSPWMRKRIFPGAYVPTVREAIELFEPWNISVLDVENLRPHYARTAEHWLERFEESQETVTRMFGPEFVRGWRLYLASVIAGFRAGRMQLFQVLFSRAGYQHVPWTRAHLYDRTQSAEPEPQWKRVTS